MIPLSSVVDKVILMILIVNPSVQGFLSSIVNACRPRKFPSSSSCNNVYSRSFAVQANKGYKVLFENNLRDKMEVPIESWGSLANVVSRTVPDLSEGCHKGSSGRIGVLGGSERYTGAPYYAAMSSLRNGADLASVFCSEEAAIPIKSYSPELMVLPIYSSTNNVDGVNVSRMVEQVEEMLDKMHSFIVGPGLGRDSAVLEAASQIVSLAREKEIPVVLDADGLCLLTMPEYSETFLSHSIDHSYSAPMVITPNAAEYQRLVQSLGNGNENTLLNKLRGKHIVLVKKGFHDVISHLDNDDSSKELAVTCTEQGGLKRSGGIGDILAGSIGTFLAWNRILHSKSENNCLEQKKQDVLMACWASCSVTKRATRLAFDNKKRSMTAPDILDFIGISMDQIVSP